MTLSQSASLTKLAVAKTLDFNDKSFIDQLSLPLNQLGINAFFYSKFINNGRVNCLSNNVVWLQHLHDNIHKYKNNFENQFHFRGGFSVDLMNIFPKREMVLDMYEHQMRNGIYLTNVSKDKNYAEVFIFTTPEASELSSQKLYENINKLHQFSLSFKEKAHQLIQKTQLIEKEIGKINSIHIANPHNDNNFLEIKKYYLGAPFDDIYLTQTQFLYLKEFLLGKSAKQIARLRNVSIRTVEKQLQLIREKLNCNSKNQLIDIIRYSSLFYSIFLQD